MKFLLKMLGKNKWMYLFSSFLFILAIFFRTLEPRVFQWLTDDVIHFKRFNDTILAPTINIPLFSKIITKHITLSTLLLYYAFIYFAITVVRAILVFIANIINSSSTENSLYNLRNRIFDHVQNLSYQNTAGYSRGEIIQRSTNDLEVIKDFIQNNITELVRTIFLFVFSFIMIYRIYPLFAFICICLSPVSVFVSILYYKKESQVWNEREGESDKLNSVIQENIHGIRTIKAFGKERKAINDFEIQNQIKLNVDIRHIKLHSFFWPVLYFINFAQIVISIIAGVYLASNGHMTLGGLMGGYIYINLMSQPLKNVSELLSKFSMAMVASLRIKEIINIPREEETESEIKSFELKGDIVFKDVSFCYPGETKYALKNVSFHIQQGEKVAVIGPTGSGKSTIVKLILRLYEPATGKIYLDGKDITTYPKKHLRSRLGVALQNSVLFSATIEENLKTVKPGAEEGMLIDAMKKASIESLLHKTKYGLKNMIGEKGVNLSGGQKQRMALARLILKDPDIFILDDITSSIDELNEQAIYKELKDVLGKKTCITISHKLLSIVFAHKVIVLNNGSVVQIGNQHTLATTEGYFNFICNLQAGGELLIDN